MDYKILEEIKRMCEFYGFCHLNCPLWDNESCAASACNLNNPAEIAAIIEKWAAEHPVKTYADVFFEKFPNAQRSCFDNKSPTFPACCVWEELKHGGCCTGECRTICWQQPYPEGSDEK